MKLLIVTQSVNENDPVLGFFCGWLATLASHFEKIIVITLSEEEHHLPTNVFVYSLGKEKGRQGKGTYAFRFISLVWKLRREYNTVFVHMNQEYILIAGWLWKLLGKRIYFWRNHQSGSLATDFAAAFCRKIFCTSKFSYTTKFKKTIFMPVGIDTSVFKVVSSVQRAPNSILFLGRIAPVKRPDVLLKALDQLAEKGISFTLSLYGDFLPRDRNYLKSLERLVAEKKLQGMVRFYPGIPNRETPKVYSAHQVFVNLSPSGLFDKTIFEAAACGTLIVTSHKMLKEIFLEGSFREGDADSLAEAIKELFQLPPEKISEERLRLRQFVEEHHSLQLLSERLVKELSS